MKKRFFLSVIILHFLFHNISVIAQETDYTRGSSFTMIQYGSSLIKQPGCTGSYDLINISFDYRLEYGLFFTYWIRLNSGWGFSKLLYHISDEQQIKISDLESIKPIDFSRGSISIKGTFNVYDRGNLIGLQHFLFTSVGEGESEAIEIAGLEGIPSELKKEALLNEEIKFSNFMIEEVIVAGICPEEQLNGVANKDKAAGVIKEADILFSQRKYLDAKAKYKEALALDKTSSYAENRISESDEKIVEKENNDKFAAQMKKADDLMSAHKFAEAKTEYDKALAMKPNDAIAMARKEEAENQLAAEKEKQEQVAANAHTQTQNNNTANNSQSQNNNYSGNQQNNNSYSSDNSQPQNTQQQSRISDAERQKMLADYNALVVQNQQMEQDIQQSVANIADMTYTIAKNISDARKAKLEYQKQMYEGLLRDRERKKILSTLNLYNEKQDILAAALDTAWILDVCLSDVKSGDECGFISTYKESQDQRRLESLRKLGIWYGAGSWQNQYYLRSQYNEDRSLVLYYSEGNAFLRNNLSKTTKPLEGISYCLSDYSIINDTMLLYSSGNAFFFNSMFKKNPYYGNFFFESKNNSVPRNFSMSPNGRYLTRCYSYRWRYIWADETYPYFIYSSERKENSYNNLVGSNNADMSGNQNKKATASVVYSINNHVKVNMYDNPNNYIDLGGLELKEKIDHAETAPYLSFSFFPNSNNCCALNNHLSLSIQRFPYSYKFSWNLITGEFNTFCDRDHENKLVDYTIRISQDSKHLVFFTYSSNKDFHIYLYDVITRKQLFELKPELLILNDVFFDSYNNLVIGGVDLNGFFIWKEYDLENLLKKSENSAVKTHSVEDRLIFHCNLEQYAKAIALEPLADKSNYAVQMSLGYSYLMTQSTDKALLYFDMAQSNKKDFIYDLRGVIFYAYLEAFDLYYTDMQTADYYNNMVKFLTERYFVDSSIEKPTVAKSSEALQCMSYGMMGKDGESLRIADSLRKEDNNVDTYESVYLRMLLKLNKWEETKAYLDAKILADTGDMSDYYIDRALLNKFVYNDSLKAMQDFKMVQKEAKDKDSYNCLLATYYLGKKEKAVEDLYKNHENKYPLQRNIIWKGVLYSMFFGSIGDAQNCVLWLKSAVDNGLDYSWELVKYFDYYPVRNEPVFQQYVAELEAKKIQKTGYYYELPNNNPVKVKENSPETGQSKTQITTSSQNIQQTEQTNSATVNVSDSASSNKPDSSQVMNSRSNETRNNLSDADYQQLGASDAAAQYQCRHTGRGWVAVSCILSPVFGLIPAIIVSKTPPAEKNLEYKNAEMMKNPTYRQAYINKAHEMKKKDVWAGYKEGTAAFIVGCILLAIQM